MIQVKKSNEVRGRICTMQLEMKRPIICWIFFLYLSYLLMHEHLLLWAPSVTVHCWGEMSCSGLGLELPFSPCSFSLSVGLFQFLCDITCRLNCCTVGSPNNSKARLNGATWLYALLPLAPKRASCNICISQEWDDDTQPHSNTHVVRHIDFWATYDIFIAWKYVFGVEILFLKGLFSKLHHHICGCYYQLNVSMQTTDAVIVL